jgi:hypothetical protein
LTFDFTRLAAHLVLQLATVASHLPPDKIDGFLDECAAGAKEAAREFRTERDERRAAKANGVEGHA